MKHLLAKYFFFNMGSSIRNNIYFIKSTHSPFVFPVLFYAWICKNWHLGLISKNQALGVCTEIKEIHGILPSKESEKNYTKVPIQPK